MDTENQTHLVKTNGVEIKLKILYEDNHIIVVEKPVNIPSQGDKTGDIDMLTIVKQYIKEKYNKPGNVYLGLVHRLDRPVGGVMVFAKTSKAAARLSEQVREKVFKKNYLVIVDGKFDKNKGNLQDYLLKNEKTNMSKVVKEGTKNSKYAELDYEVLKYDPELNLSVLKINLHKKCLKFSLYGQIHKWLNKQVYVLNITIFINISREVYLWKRYLT